MKIKKAEKKKDQKPEKRIRILLIAGLAVIGFWLLAMQAGERLAAAIDQAISREQQEAFAEIGNVLTELEGLTEELGTELGLARGERDSAVPATYRARWLSLEEKKRLLEILGEIDWQNSKLEHAYNDYRTDLTVQAYWWRDRQIDKAVGNTGYLMEMTNQLVRRGEIWVMMGKIDNSDRVLAQDAFNRVDKQLRWLKPMFTNAGQ